MMKNELIDFCQTKEKHDELLTRTKAKMIVSMTLRFAFCSNRNYLEFNTFKTKRVYPSCKNYFTESLFFIIL